jgi:large subunit ribosomal protein L25
MQTVELEAEPRTASGKGAARQLRRAGKVPGIFYGPQSHATMITIDAKEFGQKVSALEGSHLIQFRSAAGNLSGKVVLVKDAQYDPVGGHALHADFYEVNLAEKIQVAAPLHFVGKAVGVAMGGILQPLERDVQVECLPRDIPEFIAVDVSALNIHDTVHVGDVVPPPGVSILYDSNFPLVTVLPPTVEQVRAPEAAAEEAPAAAPAEGSAS